jgi:predicted Zn-dependent protease
MTDHLDIARRIVELVGSRGEAEALVYGGTSALTRFANSFIHQNVAETGASATLRVAVDGKVASSSSNRLDDKGLRALVEETLEIASLQPVDPDWPGVAPEAAVADTDCSDASTEAATPEDRAAVVGAFVDADRGTLAAGYCDTEIGTVAFANSRGQAVSGRSSRATIDGIHQTRESAGSAHQTSRAFADLDGAAAGELAVERTVMGKNAYDIKPGEYEVVLAPEAVGTIAIFLGYYGFNGKQVAEGQSFVDLGAEQFDGSLSITDDPLTDDALGVPFDAEGVPRRTIDLVRDGVTIGVVHDRRSARKLGSSSTGHGSPGSATYGPIPLAMRIGGGASSVEDLIAGVDRGLYVATFNYCRILDPKSMVVTGLTRNGTFMIENGEITGAVTNMRFTQSFLAALGPDTVLGIGDDARFADSEFGAGFVHVPSLRLAAWNFTGGAEG